MKKNFLTLGLLLLIITFVLAGCALKDKKSEIDNEKIKVVVTILPLVEFVEKVGGNRVEVEAIIPPGYEPHSYELTPNILTKISEADLYVKAGQVEFEKSSISKIKEQNENMEIIDGSEGINLRNLEEHSHHEEDNDHEEKINEGEKDPHTWLSVKNAKIYTENIYEALIELDPEDEDYYKSNKETYLAELDKLDKYLKETLSQIKNKKMIVYHPAFGYLLDEYGFEQIAIETEGKEPTAGQIEELINKARAENIKIIFVQKQFSAKNAETVASEINGLVVQIDPLAQNFTENLEDIGNKIKENL